MTHEKHNPDAVDLGQEVLELEQLMSTHTASGLSCPECGGSLWQIDSGRVNRYQCHIGHAYLLESLIKCQGEEIERHLWSGLRLLREQAIAARQLAAQARSQNRHPQETEQIEAQVQQALHQAELMRQVLLSTKVSPILENRLEPPTSDSSFT